MFLNFNQLKGVPFFNGTFFTMYQFRWIYFFLLVASSLIGEPYPEEIVWPEKLQKGDLIGIFTPSWPAHIILRDKYLHALQELKKAGFEYVEGNLTASLASEGYRTASSQERADEFMELIRNPQVKCLMATIGGYNSSSLIPFLDYDEIRKAANSYVDIAI